MTYIVTYIETDGAETRKGSFDLLSLAVDYIAGGDPSIRANVLRHARTKDGLGVAMTPLDKPLHWGQWTITLGAE